MKNALQSNSHLVSGMKTISWRIIATATTTILAWLFTGEIATALKIGGVEFLAKMVLYYLHERAWIGIVKATQSA